LPVFRLAGGLFARVGWCLTRSLVGWLTLGYPVVNESCGGMMGRGKMGGESWVTYFLWLDRQACSLPV
jgi:hypothetical protein